MVKNLQDEGEKRDLKFCVDKAKRDLSNITSVVGADGDKQILLDNPVIACLKEKGYRINGSNIEWW